MLKKCTFTVLFTVLAMAGVSAAATITPDTDGNNCYLIGTAAELYGFAAIVNGTIEGRDAEPAACGVLTQNITVNENVLPSAGGLNAPPEGGFISWNPIGNSEHPFIGTFDGQGHTISGLYFNDPDEGLNVGLFGYIGSIEEPVSETVSIRNVGIEDSYFNAQSAVGGVVGWVENVALNMENVYNAAVVAGASFVGGVVGDVSLYDPLTLSMVNVYNVGSVNGDDAEQTGGLVGYFVNESEESKITIKNSYNYGTVGGGNSLVGTVESDHEGYVAVTVTNSFYLGSSSSGDYGTVRSATDFSNGTVFAALRSAEGGEVWRQYSGDSYPTFAAKTGKDPIATHSVTLHYSATESETIYFAEGVAAPLPTADAAGNVYIWYANSDLTGTPYFEIPATATSDLQLYPKKMNLVDNYYEIDDADMLFRFADLVNNQNTAYASAKAKLTKDIVVNQNVLGTNNANVGADGSYNNAQAASSFTPWTPIGMSSANAFKGTFDGQGHTISGLYFNNSETNNVGLFGYTSGAVTIDGVGVVDSYFCGKDYVGSLVGQAVSSGANELTVTKSYNTGSVNGMSNVGGLVGKNGNVKFSYNTGSVTGTTKVGGLVGSNANNSGQNVFEINGSYNVGLVKMGTGVGNAVLGEGCPASGQTSAVKNVYYLGGSGDECSGAYSMTSYEFADGFVAITLHNDKNTSGADIWGQVVGADKTPVLTGEIKFLLNDGCFEIASKEDLYLFAAAVNNGVNSEVCVKLTQDIVVNENVLANVNSDGTLKDGVNFTPWTPIGNWDNPFQGTFQGQGHTISGLYFNDAYTEDVGLFGDVYGTVTIDNVGLVDSYIKAKSYVGGLVGYARGSLDISNSYNASSVNTPGSGFGGLVGGARGIGDAGGSLTISNSYNVGQLNGNTDGGGLVGYADELVVSNSYNAGSIYISEKDAYVGGITSSVDKASSVTNSFNYGSISYPTGNSVNKDDLVADGGEGEVTVTNSFTIGESRFDGDGSTKMTSDKFKDGTVFAALHSAEDGEVWRQYKNDAYPTFAAKTGTDAPAPMHVATLHYSETDSVAIAYTQGETLTLPTEDKSGNPIAGWTTSADGTGAAITEIPTTATTDLKLYPKVESFKPNADGYYEIATADDLYKFAEIVNNGTAPDAKAKLKNDIVVNQNVLKNASGESCVNDDGSYNTTTCPDLRVWTPIGEGSYSFNGSFDGQGHTISGLYINEPVLSGSGYNALFANVGGTSVTIKNVGIEDSYFSGQRYVGGFVGRSIASSLIIENCYNAATLYGINGLGGLVGELNSDINSLTIENCYNFGTIKYNTSTGGIPAQTGALVGEDQGKTVVLNSFYLEQEGVESDFGTAATSEAFGDGTVALLLHGEGASVWGQKVGTDSHPNFYKGIEGASPSENGPGVIENGSLSSITVTLHYSKDATDTSKFEHVVGIIEKLPATDKKGNFVLGWYKKASFEGDKYVEVPTAEDDLDFYAKIMEVVEGCYQIADAEMLFEFADMVNNQNEVYGGACAKLTEDIEVNKNVLTSAGELNTAPIGGFIEWTPIGAGDSHFAGTFDGQGHTISGLYFNDGEKSSVGLFGYVAGSGKIVSISNVGVEDSYFGTTREYAGVGGIVGYIDERTTVNIENAYSKATVVGAVGDSYVGGLVGDFGGYSLNITNSYNAGVVKGASGGDDYGFGGLVGENYGDEISISNSFNYGTVSCSGEYCGAIIGLDEGMTSVTNSYYLGDAAQGDYGTVKSEDDFSDGAVYAALHSAEDGEVWRQYKDDAYPTLVAKTGTDAPAPMHVAVLHYSETDSVAIAYTEGETLTLPTELPDGSIVVGDWYKTDDLSGTSYTQIAATEKGDLNFYAKAFKPNADGYYEIATADDLYKFAEIVNNGTVPDAKAMLVADICVNACGDGESVLGENNANVDATTGEYTGSTSGLREWTPIGNRDKPFQGSFDGQGHTISGLYFNDVNAVGAGLFGTVDGTVSINNVGLVDSYIKAGLYAGGLVGYAQGSLTINNSYNASSVNAPGQTFGGLVGAASLGGSSLAISNSYNVGPLNGKGYGGGLVGFANELVVTNSYNAGSIYNSEKGAFVGGITSLVNGATTITNCFNYGVISYPSNISVTVDDLVAEVDNNAEVTVTNSFTIGESKFEGATKVTSDEFSDGTVLIALRSGDGGNVWVQNPNDKYPSIDINATNANTIVLDWTSAADSTTLVGAGYMAGAVVVVKAGKTFYADGKIYEGVLSAEQVAAIGDNKLYPIGGVKLETVGSTLVATLNGDANESIVIPTDVEVSEVVYERVLTKGVYATIMVPFSVPVSSVSGFSFYKFKRVGQTNEGKWAVYVSTVKDSLRANTPYIIVASNNATQITFKLDYLTLNTTSDVYETTNGNWTMKGVYERKDFLKGDPELGKAYGFAGDTTQVNIRIGRFVRAGDGSYVLPMGVYLVYEEPKMLARPGQMGSSFARINVMPENISVEIEDEEETTVVKHITVAPTFVKSSDRWFDMKGRSLGEKPTAKGTYYHNGQRVIIK